nr:MAG TPA: hypothetical protein [Caudoviricetes sp.]
MFTTKAAAEGRRTQKMGGSRNVKGVARRRERIA